MVSKVLGASYICRKNKIKVESITKRKASTYGVQPPSHLTLKNIRASAKGPEGETTSNYRPEVLIKQWTEDINTQHSIYYINHELLANPRVVIFNKGLY